ncbi:MAG: hypothetical protein WDM85_14695 [Caulobacteraceae bacterium]
MLAAIAFNDPGFVERQIALVKRHVADCVHLIADNSTDEAALAPDRRDRRRRWLRLSEIATRPLDEAGARGPLARPGDDLGLAQPAAAARPASFGFLDHDIFSDAPDRSIRATRGPSGRGQVRDRSSGHGRWYLWAGFCFFRFDAVQRHALNFSVDWNAGLDTGGANWFSLYRHLQPSEVDDLGVRYEPIGGDAPAELRLEWIGDWLHAGNFSLPLTVPSAQRAALLALKRGGACKAAWPRHWASQTRLGRKQAREPGA